MTIDSEKAEFEVQELSRRECNPDGAGDSKDGDRMEDGRYESLGVRKGEN